MFLRLFEIFEIFSIFDFLFKMLVNLLIERFIFFIINWWIEGLILFECEFIIILVNGVSLIVVLIDLLFLIVYKEVLLLMCKLIILIFFLFNNFCILSVMYLWLILCVL